MKRIAIVTGASSGLGAAFARALDRQGGLDELWLVARREERLLRLSGELETKCLPLPLDLREEGSVLRLRRRLEAEQAEVRVLVNAAGFGKFGTCADMTLEETREMIALNCRAAVELTAAALP